MKPTPEDRTKGLYPKYLINHADGSPTDGDASYFVLRYDFHPGCDPIHVDACRAALRTYASLIRQHLPTLSIDLLYALSEPVFYECPLCGTAVSDCLGAISKHVTQCCRTRLQPEAQSRNLPACAVERVEHEVIENKLLNALEDSDKVALVVTREDLDRLIYALNSVPLETTGRSMLAGLRKLRDSAFASRKNGTNGADVTDANETGERTLPAKGANGN